MTDDADAESAAESVSDEALPTMTVDSELDPARSLMYKQALDAAGPLVEEFIDQQIVQAVTYCYDNRDQLEQQLRQQQGQQLMHQMAGDDVESASDADTAGE